jgi:SAM-dependent methyltransferase
MLRRCLAAAATEQVYPYHEPGALSGHRRRLLHRAAGSVLDLSSRWTRNQACYRPGTVEHLTVLSAQLTFARPPEWTDDQMVEAPDVLAGTIDSVAPPEGTFDTVVATMALCTASDLDQTLASIARWLRPGGLLLILEHVRGTGLTGLAQRAAAPVGAALGAGCRVDQDLAGGLRRAGFDLTDAARFTTWLAAGVPTPFLAGVARVRTAAG